MKIRGLIAAIIVLAALGGTLYWSNHHLPSEDKPDATDVPPKILSLKEAEIDSLAVKKKDADNIELKKDGNDWKITAPHSFLADPTVITGMTATLSNLDSQRLVENSATDLSPFGLSNPAIVVNLSEGKKTQQVLIGDATPTGSAVYVKLADDPRIFTTASFNKASLDKTLADLRDKRLFTVSSEKIVRVELLQKQQNIEFGRDKEQWQILKPKPMRADGSQVDELVRIATDSRMDLSGAPDQKKNAAAFVSGTSVGSLRITGDSGTQELQLRKVKDDFYAKTSIADGVYKITGTLGTEFAKKLDDFRNKKIFDAVGEPAKIEMHDGAKAYFFTHKDSEWWSADGKKLDADSADQLAGKLRELQATKFADFGFASPAIEVAVTSADGKQVEKISIAKGAGTDYIAERQGDSTLYVLDGATVADLQKSAADVKPAASPKK